MKSQIPRYGRIRGELEKLKKTFNPSDIKRIDDFILFCGATGGKHTLEKYHRIMVKICDCFDGNLDKIDLPRLRLFLYTLNHSDLMPPTKNEIRKVLKRFLKENYADWNTRFKQLKDIKGEKEINQEKINADTILSPKEREVLFRGCPNLKYTAFLVGSYEVASRPEEQARLKWKHLDLEKGSVRLRSSKTGNIRINPIKDSILHYKRWKQEYPYPNVCADDWVFPSPRDRSKHQSVTGAGDYVRELGKKLLGRSIFLYLLRHTRATELQKVLPAKIYEKFMDHSIETATRYSHLDKEDVRDVMFEKVYKVDEISDEKKYELEKEFDAMKLREQSTKKELELLRKMESMFVSKFKAMAKKQKSSDDRVAEMMDKLNAIQIATD